VANGSANLFVFNKLNIYSAHPHGIAFFSFIILFALMVSRAWVFTVNNYSEAELASLKEQHPQIKYLVGGKEVGENETPHIQGYMELSRAHRIAGAKLVLGIPRAHLEIRRGTSDQADEYCQKDGDFFQVGNRSKPGQRNDLAALIPAAADNKTYLDACIAASDFLRHPQTYIRLRADLDSRDAEKWRVVTVKVYFGRTGTGKTRKAMNNESVYKLDTANNLWFDGYNRETRLVIDDFYGWIKYGHLLQLLDGYKMRLEVKGGFCYAFWVSVIITSNKDVDLWYPNVNDTSALRRRITKIKEFV